MESKQLLAQYYERPAPQGRSPALGAAAMTMVLVACLLALAVHLGAVDYPTFLTAVAAPTDDYTEASTGVVYPAKTKVAADPSGDYRLLGAGARIKNIGPIGVRVYAVAYYAEAKAAKAALKAYQGKSVGAVTSTPGFYDALTKGAFNKMVELKMRRAVDRDTMVDALQTALDPRLAARIPEKKDELLQQFGALFTDKGFKTGDSIRIFQVGKGLSVSVNGDRRPTVTDPKLCEAFFAIYTDTNSPAPDARKHFADRLASLW